MSESYPPYPLAVVDTETLARYDDAAVLSVGITVADVTKRISFEDLVDKHSFFIKLDVQDQVARGRIKERRTIDWWRSDKVTDTARVRSLFPKSDDLKIDLLADEILKNFHRLGYNPRAVDWCDRNLFDMNKIQHIIEITCGQVDREPWDYHKKFDIVSWLRGAGVTDRYAGIDARKFPGMTYHDPVHDAALDWLRFQNTLVSQFGLVLPE